MCIFCLIFASTFLGCYAAPKKPIPTRIDHFENEFKSYSEEDQKRIKLGEIRPGFTKLQVYLAFGNPSKKRLVKEALFDDHKEKVYYKWTYTYWKSVKNELSDSEYQDKYLKHLREYEQQNEWKINNKSDQWKSGIKQSERESPHRRYERGILKNGSQNNEQILQEWNEYIAKLRRYSRKTDRTWSRHVSVPSNLRFDFHIPRFEPPDKIGEIKEAHKYDLYFQDDTLITRSD